MPAPSPTPSAHERHPVFVLAAGALLVAIFSRAQEVLIPMALAMVIAFALSPAVRTLEQRIGRGLAVALVVLVTLGSMGAFGYLLKRQMEDLSSQLANYSESMRRKVSSLRGHDQKGLVGVSKTVDKVVRELDEKVTESREARPVRVVPAEETALERFEAVVEPILRPVAHAIIVAVLVIFLLVQREELRDRFIRLAGKRNVSLTTRALDEAGRRISRFLVTQCAINAAFGLVIAFGLLLIGVPYAPLWGVVATVLRFVPFVGILLAMLLPAAVAFAQIDGWWHTLATLGLFLGLDIITAYLVEPLMIGHKTGVSSMAMVASAIFWTWLWGPLGLVLSTPLTVCLAVLGRQVPKLGFLAVLLGDEPALEAEVAFYQRLLAGDDDEAAAILEKRLQTSPREQVFDQLVVPAVLMAEGDRARGEISESDRDDVVRTMRALVVSREPEPPPAQALAPCLVLGVPTRNSAEELIWELLAQLLDPAKVRLKAVGAAALASEVTAAAVEDPPDLVCMTSLPPGGLSQVRYLCKRLHAARPEVRVLVFRSAVGPEAREAAQALTNEGAVTVVFSLSDARNQIDQLLALAPAQPPA